MVFQPGLSGPTLGFPFQRIGQCVYSLMSWFNGWVHLSVDDGFIRLSHSMFFQSWCFNQFGRASEVQYATLHYMFLSLTCCIVLMMHTPRDMQPQGKDHSVINRALKGHRSMDMV